MATRSTTARCLGSSMTTGSASVLRRGAVYGTHWHGLFDNDAVRRRWLAEAAVAAGRLGFTGADDANVLARGDSQLDLMADLLAAHTDADAILGLLEAGPPRRPTIVSMRRG